MRKQTACEFEPTVVKSFKSNFQTDEIAEHIYGCADCQETAKVVRFFQSNLTHESPSKNLPVAGFVWWKSRLREKQRAAEQVAQPILIVQTVAVVVLVGVLIWLFDNGSLQVSSLNRIFASLEKVIVPMFAVILCFLFTCSILIFTLRGFLSEK